MTDITPDTVIRFRASKLLGFSAVVILTACAIVWFRGGASNFNAVAYANETSTISLESKMINVGAVDLHVVFSGPEDGEPIVLLHGFPEFWYVWRDHIEMLGKAGYRVAAPDMRGYNKSAKPTGRKSYTLASYANDITGLLDSQGWQQANIVGHDVGGQVSWQLVFEHPERIRSAVIYSVPHPLAKTAIDEEPKSTAYRTFLNLPILPELVSRSGGFALIAKNMRETSMPGTFSNKDINIFKAAWDRNQAFASMIGYYRVSQAAPPSMPRDGKPAMPVMFYFGMEDNVIASNRARDTISYLGDESVVLYPELSHWLISEAPEQTANDIITFISQSEDSNVTSR